MPGTVYEVMAEYDYSIKCVVLGDSGKFLCVYRLWWVTFSMGHPGASKKSLMTHTRDAELKAQ